MRTAAALMSGLAGMASGAPTAAVAAVRRQDFSTVDNSGNAEVEAPADHTKLNLGLRITFGLIILLLGVVIGGRAWQRAEENLKISRMVLELTRRQTEMQGDGLEVSRKDLALKQEDTEFKRQELALRNKSVGIKEIEHIIHSGVGSPASALHQQHFAGVEPRASLSVVPSRDAPSGVGARLSHDHHRGVTHNDDVSFLDVNSPSHAPHGMSGSSEKV